MATVIIAAPVCPFIRHQEGSEHPFHSPFTAGRAGGWTRVVWGLGTWALKPRGSAQHPPAGQQPGLSGSQCPHLYNGETMGMCALGMVWKARRTAWHTVGAQFTLVSSSPCL